MLTTVVPLRSQISVRVSIFSHSKPDYFSLTPLLYYHVPDVAKIERGKKLGKEKKQIG
jgi:hypothetical protein